MKNTRDKKLWIFNAGNSFAGNPKWLFEYIIRHRKDITPVWMCYEKDTYDYVTKLQYKAALYASGQGKKYMQQAGVYVVEMCKEVFQPELQGITILNLWHGVGCKSIERKVVGGFLWERLVRKYIMNNEMYLNNQLFLVTSPLMEEHFKSQCGIEDSHVIRAGYPRCTVSDPVCTYNHDILSRQGLTKDHRLAIYAPTFREVDRDNFITKAIPDWKRLIEVLQKEKIVLILKMHPLVEKDAQYLELKEFYKDCPYLCFWDNKEDVYEIFNNIDIAITDYSSIFYDLQARGVKHFIRYFFDIDDKENLRDFVFDVQEMTCGPIAGNFEELLSILQSSDTTETEDLARIHDLFWSYTANDDCEHIINDALAFTPEQRELPTLYSFDIFDTLIGRNAIFPTTVFGYVERKIQTSNLSFSELFVRNYSSIRQGCEKNVREFYRKSTLLRKDDHLEIKFDQIFERMQDIYHLSDDQILALKQWEIEGEKLASIPIRKNIDYLKELKTAGNDVVMISDMYLPEEVVRQLLHNADPFLDSIPLYLSSTVGHQKTTKRLFLHVFSQLDYKYGNWIHIGDNNFADNVQPASLGIETQPIEIESYSDYEKSMCNFTNNYEFRKIAKMIYDWRIQQEERSQNELYSYCYATTYLVPYVKWAVDDAIRRELDTLYFISRDGHYLKIIADAIIETKHYDIKTKYIYGSRKAWRIPSFITEVDEDFFEHFGNLNGIQNFDKLLSSLHLTEEKFQEFFPELMYIKNTTRWSEKFLDEIRGQLKSSSAYRNYLLELAKEERSIVVKYLQQEIDFTEKFAFLEYWGRGYTQDCLVRLMNEANGGEIDSPMYYVRSIYPSIGHSIRYNFTEKPYSLLFVESIFSNVPYKTISAYQEVNGRIEPVITPCDNNQDLHANFEKNFAQFARDYCALDIQDEETILHYLYNFGVSYFHKNKNQPIFLEVLGNLKDSVTMGGKVEEYAPPITFQTLIDWKNGKSFRTNDMQMSMKQTNFVFRSIYKGYAFYCKKIRDRIRRKQGKKIY